MPRPPKDKELTEEVIAFRVTKTRAELLRQQVEDLRAVGVRSHHQLCRKIVLDFLTGKLAYLTAQDRFENPTS
jgi:hypothetical protein